MNMIINTPRFYTNKYYKNNISFKGALDNKSRPESLTKTSGEGKEVHSAGCQGHRFPQMCLSCPKNDKHKRDDLTNLRGKKFLLSRLEEKMQEAKRNKQPLNLLMFDMDNFKSINELFDYPTGDFFIKKVGKHIQEVAEKNKAGSYRYGGEEFFIIFNRKSMGEVKDIAKEISEAILNDEELKAKKDDYLKAVDTKLEGLYAERNKFKNIYDGKIKYEGLCQYMQTYYTETKDRHSEFYNHLNDFTNKKRLQLVSSYKDILLLAKKIEKNPDTRLKLSQAYDCLDSFDKDEVNSVLNSAELCDYLNFIFGHEAEIDKLKSWKKCVETSQGFTITTGIRQFSGEELNKAPDELIEETGEVLKEGKSIKKGEVYIYPVNN